MLLKTQGAAPRPGQMGQMGLRCKAQEWHTSASLGVCSRAGDGRLRRLTLYGVFPGPAQQTGPLPISGELMPRTSVLTLLLHVSQTLDQFSGKERVTLGTCTGQADHACGTWNPIGDCPTLHKFHGLDLSGISLFQDYSGYKEILAAYQLLGFKLRDSLSSPFLPAQQSSHRDSWRPLLRALCITLFSDLRSTPLAPGLDPHPLTGPLVSSLGLHFS